MLNTAANRVAHGDRRLPNGNIIFQTIASWLSLRDSTWQMIPAVISLINNPTDPTGFSISSARSLNQTSSFVRT